MEQNSRKRAKEIGAGNQRRIERLTLVGCCSILYNPHLVLVRVNNREVRQEVGTLAGSSSLLFLHPPRVPFAKVLRESVIIFHVQWSIPPQLGSEQLESLVCQANVVWEFSVLILPQHRHW